MGYGFGVVVRVFGFDFENADVIWNGDLIP